MHYMQILWDSSLAQTYHWDAERASCEKGVRLAVYFSMSMPTSVAALSRPPNRSLLLHTTVTRVYRSRRIGQNNVQQQMGTRSKDAVAREWCIVLCSTAEMGEGQLVMAR